jgi:hypothetical protein
MADGEASLSTAGIPCQLPAVEIPRSFTDRFLWSYNPDASTLTEIPSTHQLSEETVQEVQAAATCAFERATRKENADDVQSISLFCPHEGGHPFVDSMVKLIASENKADVLVLDALELAAVQFGEIGEGAICSSLRD